jgi:hypothetical protein
MRMLFAGMVAAFFLIAAGSADAGCVKGAIVGGVAGHFVGHHGLLGAGVGCAIGHHERVKREREEHRRAYEHGYYEGQHSRY